MKTYEVLGRTNRLLSLIRHEPHWKRRVWQFFCFCVCIRYRGNVSTEPLPSSDRGIFIEPLPSSDRGIFTEPFLATIRGIHTHTHTHTQQRNLISLLLFFQNKESRPKNSVDILILCLGRQSSLALSSRRYFSHDLAISMLVSLHLALFVLHPVSVCSAVVYQFATITDISVSAQDYGTPFSKYHRSLHGMYSQVTCS
jgi:hypothetical protein